MNIIRENEIIYICEVGGIYIEIYVDTNKCTMWKTQKKWLKYSKQI